MLSPRARSAVTSGYLVVAALSYVVAALVAAIIVTPRVPYADAWDHYLTLLTTPFPASVLYAENGHAQWFANAVRLFSLRELAGDERLQIAIGLLLAVAAWLLLVRIVWRDLTLTPLQRAVAFFAVSFGLFWLGNARALLHNYESLHAYSVLVCLAGAISLVSRAKLTLSVVALATLLCALATFNFGSGAASFVAVAAVLIVRRAGYRPVLIVAAGFLLALLVFHGLHEGDGVPIAINAPVQSVLALRSLASPIIYLLWPLVNPDVAYRLPMPMHLTYVVARAWIATYGHIEQCTWPQAVAGTVFMISLLLVTLRTWIRTRRGQLPGGSLQCGLAMAWFGVGVAALVALTRLQYFAQFPAEVYAPRYLPWSSLAWAGLLVANAADLKSIRATAGMAIFVSIAALTAEREMTWMMVRARTSADDTAVAAVVGIWPDTVSQGETDSAAVARTAPLMRALRIGPFAWPAAAAIGKVPPADARAVAIVERAATPVANGVNHDAVRLTLTLAPLPCAAAHVLLAENDRIVGLVRHVDRASWRGAAFTEDANALSAFVACGK